MGQENEVEVMWIATRAEKEPEGNMGVLADCEAMVLTANHGDGASGK